ncbi:response regulator [Methylobacterium oryzihabitans]|uniref:Sensory/regulatory protein RpfC n=2 Tax=Methylobacterium oryzihabitans TaxID=2499852 RepID=A0A437NT61_9HYPH|nr:response regulator [Methylobacterium oryzihabitans]
MSCSRMGEAAVAAPSESRGRASMDHQSGPPSHPRAGSGDEPAPVRRDPEMLGLPAAALLDALPHKAWLLDAAGATAYANAQARDGHPDLAAGETWTGTGIHPEDRLRGGEVRVAAMARGQASRVTVRLRDRGGEWIWHRVDTSPVPRDDGAPAWMMTAVATEETATERSLETTSNLLLLAQTAAGAGIWDWNMRSGALALSPEGARLHGLPAQACTITSATWTALIEAEDRSALWSAVTQAVSTDTPFMVEVRIRDGSEDVRWIQSRGRVLTDPAGVPSRIVGLTLDVTARKEAERSLAEARDQAEEASRAKSEFLATMSHEIRTPLNAVLGFTDLLLDRPHDPETQRHLGHVHEAGSALLRVVDDILDFSQIEAGRVELDPQPFVVRDLVDGTVSMIRTIAAKKQLRIAVDLDPTLPLQVVGDVGRVRQVLLNLLNNAIKFTPSGSVTLSVHRERTDEGVAWLHFAVNDTGIGISQSQRDRLFRRFSQGDGSIRRHFGGTGLGLAICRRLVALMGGSIGLDSKPGQGSTLWFVLPLPPAPEERQGADDAAPALPAAAGGRILLAEDMPLNQELVRSALAASGYEVDVACDGAEAVEAVLTRSYDVILMDVQMPVMDGLSATRAIRRLPGPVCRVPIIAMTANVLPPQIAQCREAGMDDHIGKPFRREVLSATIARWMSGEAADTAA